jgi:ankyrin repeat protein
VLHEAAQWGAAECCELLVRAGALLEALDTMARTPLHVAAQCGHANTAHKLLELGARPEALDADGDAPADMALWSGNIVCVCVCVCVRPLLRHGIRAPVSWAPAHIAAARDDAAALAQLLRDDALADREARTALGDTPLHVAAACGSEACAKLLLDLGADVDARNRARRTPMRAAAIAASEGTLALLLARGAERDAFDARGFTPLRSACSRVSPDHLACVTRLLGAGADADFVLRRTDRRR